MKPKAIIFVIDGTVAHNDHRSYHDYSESVLKDKPIQPVINALRFYQRQGYKIIFLTGRKDVCYDHTKQWIENHIGHVN